MKAITTFEAGLRKVLLKTRTTGVNNARKDYAVAADGQHFLINTLVTESAPTPITIVLNWSAELKR